MAKFALPKRKYCDGEKKLTAIRLPIPLLKELDSMAQDRGWTLTDVITTGLDQLVQWHEKERGKKGGL